MRISKGHVSMTTKEFVSEHSRLINVLQNRQLSKLRREAREQSSELHKVQQSKTHVKPLKKRDN